MLPHPPDPLEILDAGQESRAALFSPSRAYMTGEENLRVTAVCNTASVTLTINGRQLRPDSTPSPLNETLKPTSNRVVTTGIFGLAEGWLLGLTVRATAGSPPAGSTWVLLELVRGSGSQAQLVQTLGYGFVTANKPYAWPLSANTDPFDGAGHLRLIVGATPAAGAEISETVPTGAQWELISFEADLTTAVAVANRVPVFTIDDGANIYYRAPVNGNETASATWRNILTTIGSVNNGLLQNVAVEGAPSNLRLPAGHRIRTATIAIQGADQYAAPIYLVRERFTLE